MSSINDLLGIMLQLRDPENGCPWDVEQDLASIAPYTIEEAYEVADAIARGDAQDLKQELGDLLFQVVFHTQMAKEQGWFDFEDVVQAISDKMTRRHPHVFGDANVRTATEQAEAWEAQKARERSDKGLDNSILDDVPVSLPALTRAVKLQKRAARVGFDWPEYEAVLAKAEEEWGELLEALHINTRFPLEGEPMAPDVIRGRGEGAKQEIPPQDSTVGFGSVSSAPPQKESDKLGHDAIEEEFGDVLFTFANLARHLGIDPEAAARTANAKFERRFKYIEQSAGKLKKSLKEMSLEEMESLWRKAKHDVR